MAKRDKGAKLSAWRRAAYAAARARGEDPRPNAAEMRNAFPAGSPRSPWHTLQSGPARPIDSNARNTFTKGKR